MKKIIQQKIIFSLVFILFVGITPQLYSQTVFDWSNGQTSQTVDGTTLTYTPASGTAINSGIGAPGQSVFVVAGTSKATLNFSSAVAVGTIGYFPFKSHTVTFTDPSGNNSPVSIGFSANSRQVVTLNWTNVTDIELTSNTGSASFPVDAVSLLGFRVNSIERQTPTDATTSDDEVTFRVTFSDDAARVSADDFILSGTAAADGTIASLTRVNDKIYDVKVTGLTNSSGTVNLDIKGVDGSGSNNIIKLTPIADANESGNYTQDSGNDSQIGQSFKVLNSGILNSVALQRSSFHSYSGTATLKIFSGQTVTGTPLITQEINITSGSGFETYVFTNPATVSAGSTYTWLWERGSGSGSANYIGTTSNPYADGIGYISSLGGFASSIDFVFQTIVVSDLSVVLSTTLPSSDETYTISNPPTVTTTVASNILNNSATLGGNVTTSGISVTERGIVYSTTDQTPEIGETGVIKDTNGSGLGAFSETITSLSPETTYYYRAYSINSDGTGYGEVRSFTTLGVSINSITRQNPTDEDLFNTSATFQVTFSEPVKDVDVTDFTSNSSGATVNSVTSVSNTVYNVELNNITTNGDVFLQINGVDGVSGSNNITTLAVPTETTTVDQQNTNDYLNQSTIGQTFTASTNGVVKSVTFYPEDGQHNFSGTADLKLYSGTSNNGGTEIDSESVNISSSTDSAGQTLTFTTPVSLTSGQTYTITLSNFSGSGSQALQSHTSNQYNGGHVIFAGMNSSSHLNFDLKIRIIEEETTAGDIPLSTTAPATNEKFIKKTPPVLPVVTTADATAISETSATLGGTISSTGASAITERGIVYSTTDSYPRIGETGVTKAVSAATTDNFSDVVGSLDTKNIYFYRAYATNSNGTGYGAVKRFSLNNALHFDGSNDRVTISDNASFDFSTGFTMEGWIKTSDFSGSPSIFAQFGGGSNRAFAILLESNNGVNFSISLNGSVEQFFSSTNTIPSNQWTHVAFTFDSTTMRTFINGIASGTNAVTGTMFDSSAFIELGSRDGVSARYWEGEMDEVRIWTKARTQTEIQNAMNKRVPIDAPNLVAYYNFNQGVADGTNTGISALNDLTSNNNDGSFVGISLSGTTSNFVSGVTGNFDNTKLAPNRFTTTGNWSNTANWSQGKVPSQIENAIIAENQTVTIDVDDLEIDDFELETGATLNIPNDKEITINNTFTTNGNLSLQSDRNDSGVLLVNGSTSGTVTYVRGGLLANKWSIVTPPVSGQTIKSFAENNANDIRQNTGISPVRYAIAYYDDTRAVGSKWVYYDTSVNATDTFTAGTSYSMSRATDGSVTFTGTLAVDDVNKTLNADAWQAIGNPFTTYYPANKNSNNSFLNENFDALDDSFKSLYVWDATQEKYIAVSEVDANDRSLPPGQGFFIKMKTGQTAVNFNKEKRTTKPASGTTTFERNNTTPNITLNISKGKTTVNTHIKFFDNATDGFDSGFDIGNFDSNTLDIYSKVLDNSVETNLTIQSLPNNNYDDVVIPLGILAKKGNELTIDGIIENLPESINVYLEDRLQNSFTDLKTSKKQWVLEDDITGTGRFYLHLSSKALSTETNEFTGVSLFENNNQLHIYGLQNEATLSLYSIPGKTILSSKVEGITKTIIDLPELATGVYIVNLQSEQGTISKKIIIN